MWICSWPATGVYTCNLTIYDVNATDRPQTATITLSVHDVAQLMLDYQAETHTYTHAQSWGVVDDDSDNDTGINQGCNSHAWANARSAEWCGPQVKYITQMQSSTMDSDVASSSNFNGIIVNSTLNGYGSGFLQDDCTPSNDRSWYGGGSGNGYASLQGEAPHCRTISRLSVRLLQVWPCESSAQVNGNDIADWTSHNWWLKDMDGRP